MTKRPTILALLALLFTPSSAKAQIPPVCDYVAKMEKSHLKDYFIVRAYDDFLGTGDFTYLEQCSWGGSCHGESPCFVETPDKHEMNSLIDMGFKNFADEETEEYLRWASGSGVFRYGGAYYQLEASEESLKFPTAVSKLTKSGAIPQCLFSNNVSEEADTYRDKDAPFSQGNICITIEAEREGVIKFTETAPIEKSAYKDWREYSMAKYAYVDFDNDGTKEPIVEFNLSSGAGCGCDHDGYVLLSDDLKSMSKSPKADLLESMQDRGCGVNKMRWFVRNGKTYLENMPLINEYSSNRFRTGLPISSENRLVHTVRTVKDGKVLQVCASSFKITTTPLELH